MHALVRSVVAALLAVILVLAAGASAFAAPPDAPKPAGQVVEMQAKARGPSAEVALRRAIADAAREVNKPYVGGDAARARRFDDALRDLDTALAAPGLGLATMGEQIRALSKGLIDRVVVLDQRDAGGEREVTALVGVAVFEQRLATRKAIAVMAFRPSSPTYSFGGSPVQGNEIARLLADQATERMVQTGVLTVLDRQHIDEVARERNFVELYGRTPEELARFGKMLGADLLLVGAVETAGLETATQTVQASGYTFSRSYAGMSVAARLLDVQTGAIVWADTLSVGLDHSQLSRMFNGGSPDPSGTLSAIEDEMSRSLVNAVVENVAPIKVAMVDGDAVWVNRGTGRLEPGMRLQIRGGEAEIVDPDTGESLGVAERTLAVVEVVAVDARKSQCRLIEGDLAQVRPGAMARPLATR